MKRSTIILIHMVFWALFVIAPMLIFRLDDFHNSDEIWHFLQMTLINVVVFYLAYFVLIPRLLKKRKTGELVLILLGWIILLSAVRLAVVYYLREYAVPLESRPYVFDRHLFRDVFGTMMFTVYAVLIYFSLEWFRERQYRFELAREKQKSEIDLLKSQMNPHFLMNTLNNLYSLVYQGSKHASDAVLKLSDIMRYMLYETKAEMVPLENEIKYIESYIELQMLRVRNQDLVDLKVHGDVGGKMIAPMLLIPFVENAFKHGHKHTDGKGITITLRVEPEKIIFEVINFKALKETQKDPESGIGLSNVTKRLELQYPDRHILEISDQDRYFKVHLEITEG